MKIKELFDVKYGVNLELLTCETTTADDAEGVNFVARTSNNNGVVAVVKKIEDVTPQASGTLSCAAGGSVLETFVQIKPYYSGRDLYVLTPKQKMSLVEKLYYCMCIKANAYKYSYGRQANKTLKNIELPDIIPDWVYKANVKPISTKRRIENIPPLCVNNWKEFKVGDYFNVSGTKTTKIDDLYEYGYGKYPYVTTQATNNGIAGFYNYSTEIGNVLTIDSAVTGYCSYHELPFSASDHVEVLTPKFNLNKYVGLFLVTVINQEQYKYSYGRKSNQKKIKETFIKLPATTQGLPDWGYMENYIKTLPYSDRI